MNPKYISFNQEVEKHLPLGTDRARLVALIVAAAVALRAPLPSSPVDDANSYYRNTVALNLHGIISEFNENCIFDASYAMQQARILWVLRYRAAHPSPVMVFDQRCSLYENMCGVGLHVSEEDCAFSTKYKREVALLLPIASSTIADACKCDWINN